MFPFPNARVEEVPPFNQIEVNFNEGKEQMLKQSEI